MANFERSDFSAELQSSERRRGSLEFFRRMLDTLSKSQTCAAGKFDSNECGSGTRLTSESAASLFATLKECFLSTGLQTTAAFRASKVEHSSTFLYSLLLGIATVFNTASDVSIDYSKLSCIFLRLVNFSPEPSHEVIHRQDCLSLHAWCRPSALTPLCQC